MDDDLMRDDFGEDFAEDGVPHKHKKDPLADDDAEVDETDEVEEPDVDEEDEY
jgi:hypothetical protein